LSILSLAYISWRACRLAILLLFRQWNIKKSKGDNRKYFVLDGAPQTQTIIRTWKTTFYFY